MIILNTINIINIDIYIIDSSYLYVTGTFLSMRHGDIIIHTSRGRSYPYVTGRSYLYVTGTLSIRHGAFLSIRHGDVLIYTSRGRSYLYSLLSSIFHIKSHVVVPLICNNCTHPG